MATPMMRARHLAEKTESNGKLPSSRERAAVRLLAAERSEEIFPVLLEEVLALGFTRALVAEVDFETGELRPTEVLNCPRGFQDRFRSSLLADNAVIQTLRRMEPAILPNLKSGNRKLYCHPISFNNRQPC